MTKLKTTLLALSATAALFLSGCGAEAVPHQDKHTATWDYEKHGPEHWGDFSGTCDSGTHQSPVNIVPVKAVSMDHSYDLSMHEDVTSKARIVDNGHSIKVTPDHAGDIELHGKKYSLIQFHFHGRSEHTINGKYKDLVAHMVHQAKDGTLAVVAVFFNIGEKNALLETIISNVGGEAMIDPQDLLPEDTAHYYHYIGSLTTPPCSENVQWYLLKNTQTVSAEQLVHFRKFYVDNERPTQPLNERFIESN
jgi:carbonic anhydrase